MSLIEGNTSVLLTYPDKLATELYCRMNQYCYKPKTIIEYRRKAFISPENDIRITFDFQVRGTEASYDIFNNHLFAIQFVGSSSSNFRSKVQWISIVAYQRFVGRGGWQ